MKKIIFNSLLGGLLSTSVYAHEGFNSRPDGHAPVGVMLDHNHRKGEVMLSYRFMRMEMDENRDGTRRLNSQEIFEQGFMISPTEMTMDMHMFGAMYAFTDKLTIITMLPYIEKSMDHLTKTGGRFTTETSGLGDLKIGAIYVLKKWAHHQIHYQESLSLPTGSIDERDNTPAGRVQLPDPMQLGSGTFDLQAGFTYLGHEENISWGAQVNGTWHLGENDEDYTLGDKQDLSAWLAYKASESTSLSLRVLGKHWEKVDSSRKNLNPMMVPTSDPYRRGGERADILAGVNYIVKNGLLSGHRMALEYGVPFYQSLNGPQLETDSSLTLGWQKAW